DIAPEDFEESGYFNRYYKGSGVSDEVNMIAPASDRVCIAYSLERAMRNSPFSKEEIANFEATLPVVAACCARHWQITRRPDGNGEPDLKHQKLLERMETLGKDTLTPRESEIVQLVLKGHSNLSIGENLGLSVETVKVHRRNIYRKLNISSLSELYSFALQHLLSGR
ncbi:MAG: LuxR C-terminal-related transcriptional regulator, partial [Pseudomonadota bacterium]|nr:LuxR C-terminal-related transcriptional regulator [Pseudomonadota bacterium]